MRKMEIKKNILEKKFIFLKSKNNWGRCGKWKNIFIV